MPRVFLFVPLVGGVALAAMGLRPPAPAVKKPVQRQSVTRQYLDNCAHCHGENGQGGGAGTGTLLTRELFEGDKDRRFFDAIKNGVPDRAMPAYGETLSDPEIWAQVVHIRELQAKALGSAAPKPDASGVYKGEKASFKVETWTPEGKGLKTPWSLDWLADGRALVTNRGGSMLILGKDGSVISTVEGLPESTEIGQGGLMDVRVHPTNGWIYLAYTEPLPGDRSKGFTKIVRGHLSGNRWSDQATVWEAPKEFYTGAGIHFGGKIVFDGKGHVFFSSGERGLNMKGQSLEQPAAKIMRVNDDGTVPKDNPYVGKSPFPAIWTWGHRNPQGLAIDASGQLWDTEHAPRGGDELNPLKKGANYGWPIVSFGINYNDSPFVLPWPKPEQNLELPIFRWLPSTGASGLALSTGTAFPSWKGDLLAGGLAGQNLDRFRVKDGKLVEREELLQGLGRVRDVRVAKDGTVYLVLNGPDKIVRLVAAP